MHRFRIISLLTLAIFCTKAYVQSNSGLKLNVVDIDAEKTLVWGPGLEPDKNVLGARYIFLQLVDKNGRNVTKTPGKKVVASHIIGDTLAGTQCHIWTQVLDCKDGSFIVRYRNYNTCFNLRITLQIKDTILTLKRSEFKGPIYEEECDCPKPLVKKWLDDNNCSKNYTQMIEDLGMFPTVDFNKIRNELIQKYNKPGSISICNYVIKSNKIYRKCYGEHVGFKTFVDTLLLSLTRKVMLPDVEFFMNLGDWPLVPKNSQLYPMFSWCGSTDTNDIVVPTYDITQSSIEAMGIGRGVTLDMLSVQGNTKLIWDEKIRKAFWRGRDSNINRLRLIDISRNHKDILNASMTNFFFSQEHEIKKYGPKEKHISFFDFFEYKYQLNLDGTVAAYRFPYLLAGDSLVLKQDSKYYEFFYRDVKENEHFVPVKSDLSNLIDQVRWAIDNDDAAYKITKKARDFVRSNLMPQNIFCYQVALIQDWSTRLINDVEILPGMEQVSQPEHKCDCIASEKGEKDEL